MSNARIDAPQVIRTAPQVIASIHLCVPWGEMRKVMGPRLSELKARRCSAGHCYNRPLVRSSLSAAHEHL
jgi:hypothetical protein